MAGERSEWVLLGDYASALEASLDLSLLEAWHVPTLVRGLDPGIFGPGFSGATPHGVRVYVPGTAVELAREVTGRAEAAEP